MLTLRAVPAERRLSTSLKYTTGPQTWAAAVEALLRCARLLKMAGHEYHWMVSPNA